MSYWVLRIYQNGIYASADKIDESKSHNTNSSSSSSVGVVSNSGSVNKIVSLYHQNGSKIIVCCGGDSRVSYDGKRHRTRALVEVLLKQQLDYLCTKRTACEVLDAILSWFQRNVRPSSLVFGCGFLNKFNEPSLAFAASSELEAAVDGGDYVNIFGETEPRIEATPEMATSMRLDVPPPQYANEHEVYDELHRHHHHHSGFRSSDRVEVSSMSFQ